MSNVNEELSKLEIYKNVKCFVCGNSLDKALLNIDGYIHHGGKMRCVDLKQCRRRQKRNK